MTIRERIEAICPEAASADHVDVKTVEGPVDLRRFLSGMMDYKPAWYKALFKVRGVLAKGFGLWHEDLDARPDCAPEDVSFEPGGMLKFFRVVRAEEDAYWVGDAGDRHLDAFVCVLVDDLPCGGRRFHTATVVVYKHWTGPVYFNLIRPFHHLVVDRMVRRGARGG